METLMKMMKQGYEGNEKDEKNNLEALMPRTLYVREKYSSFYELLGDMVWHGVNYMSIYRKTDCGKARWTDRAPILNFTQTHPKYSYEPLRLLRFYNDFKTSWTVSWTYEFVNGAYVLARDCGNCARARSGFCKICKACFFFKLKKDW